MTERAIRRTLKTADTGDLVGARDVRQALPTAVGRDTARILEHWLPQVWPRAIFAPGFIERMNRFAQLLACWGKAFNLTSRPDDPATLAFHIIDCASVLALKDEAALLRGYFEPGRAVADIGSGCGFPGVVLASGCGAHLVLFEPRRKRAAFLRIVIAELGLDNAEVSALSLPSEQIRARFDVAVGRALGAPAKFYRLAHSVLLEGGVAILYATRFQTVAPGSAQAAGFSAGETLVYRLSLAASWQRRRSSADEAGVLPDRALVTWQKVR